MKTLNDVLDALETPLKAGCVFEVYFDEDEKVFCVNLKTMAKSHCVLQIKDDGVYAYRRYDRVDKVESYSDILKLVVDCNHGRGYYHSGWHQVFEDAGIEIDNF